MMQKGDLDVGGLLSKVNIQETQEHRAINLGGLILCADASEVKLRWIWTVERAC